MSSRSESSYGVGNILGLILTRSGARTSTRRTSLPVYFWPRKVPSPVLQTVRSKPSSSTSAFIYIPPTAKSVFNIARFGVRMINVKLMGNFFKATEQSTEAATEGDSESRNSLDSCEPALHLAPQLRQRLLPKPRWLRKSSRVS